MRSCFWCDKELWKHYVTKDHIISSALGGSSLQHNVVVSCEPCNNERGAIVSVYLNYIKHSGHKDSIERALKKLPYWLSIQEKWTEIEISKLGYSPTGCLKLEISENKPTCLAVICKSVNRRKNKKRRSNQPRRKWQLDESSQYLIPTPANQMVA
jgi:hypothetical protein